MESKSEEYDYLAFCQIVSFSETVVESQSQLIVSATGVKDNPNFGVNRLIFVGMSGQIAVLVVVLVVVARQANESTSLVIFKIVLEHLEELFVS